MSLNLDLLDIACRVPLFVRSFGQKCLSDPLVKGVNRYFIGSSLEILLGNVDIPTLHGFLDDIGIVLSPDHVLILCNRCALPHLSVYKCKYHHIKPYGDYTPHHIINERDVSPYVVDWGQFVYSGDLVCSDHRSSGYPLTLCNRCEYVYCVHESNYCFKCNLWSKTIITTGFGVCSCALTTHKSFFLKFPSRCIPVPDCTVVLDGFSCHETHRVLCVTNNLSGEGLIFQAAQGELLGVTYENRLVNNVGVPRSSKLYLSAYINVVNRLCIESPKEKVKINWRRRRNVINNLKFHTPSTPCSIPHKGAVRIGT